MVQRKKVTSLVKLSSEAVGHVGILLGVGPVGYYDSDSPECQGEHEGDDGQQEAGSEKKLSVQEDFFRIKFVHESKSIKC